jgi:hypothetical protein
MVSNKFVDEIKEYGTTSVFKKYVFDYTNSDEVASENYYKHVIFADGSDLVVTDDNCFVTEYSDTVW